MLIDDIRESFLIVQCLNQRVRNGGHCTVHVDPLLGLGLEAEQVSPHVAAEQLHAALHQLAVLVLLQHQQGLHSLGDEAGAHLVHEGLQPRLNTPEE